MERVASFGTERMKFPSMSVMVPKGCITFHYHVYSWQRFVVRAAHYNTFNLYILREYRNKGEI